MEGCRTPFWSSLSSVPLAVTLAYRPIRREPFTIVSFVSGWVAGELAFQNIVWQMIATALFIWFGALQGWAGWLGPGRRRRSTGRDSSDWASPGRRAAGVTAAALGEVRSAAFPVPTEPTAPTWGRWWRVTRAIPFKSRAVETTCNIDYWGDGIRRHRLDVYRSRLAPPEKAPVMVYIHGGAWIIGDKREQGKPMMYELVARGWVCVAINYRLSPKATWPDHIVDAKRAVAWVKEHIARLRGRPVVRRGQRWIGRRPPLRPAGPECGRPRLPARVRGGGHRRSRPASPSTASWT